MSGRYIPPSMRRAQEDKQASDASTMNDKNTNTSEASSPRTLEQLSLIPRDENTPSNDRQGNYAYRNRDQHDDYRGQGRGRGRGRGRGQGSWTSNDNRHGKPHYQQRTGKYPPAQPKENEFLYEDIHTHYWPIDKPRPQGQRSTLNDSAEQNGHLVYLMLFRDANPRWESEQIIYAHTSIDILPGYQNAYGNEVLVRGDKGSDGGDEIATEEGGNDQATVDTKPTRQSDGINDTDVIKEERTDLASFIKDTLFISSETIHGDDRGSEENSTEQPSTIPKSSPDGNTQTDHTQPPTSNVSPSTNHDSHPLGHPIAVYSQSPRTPTRDRQSALFQFLGFYHLQDTTFLHPNTKALEEMMQQKWDLRDSFGRSREVKRDKSKWAGSLGQRWAICRFVKVTNSDLVMPQIERAKVVNKVDQTGDEKTNQGSLYGTDSNPSAPTVGPGAANWRHWAKAEASGQHSNGISDADTTVEAESTLGRPSGTEESNGSPKDVPKESDHEEKNKDSVTTEKETQKENQGEDQTEPEDQKAQDVDSNLISTG